MADTTDSAMRARVTGRQEVARRTVWRVTIGILEARCVRRADGEKAPFLYAVQARDVGGWRRLSSGDDPMKLLLSVIQSGAGQIALHGAVFEAGK